MFAEEDGAAAVLWRVKYRRTFGECTKQQFVEVKLHVCGVKGIEEFFDDLVRIVRERNLLADVQLVKSFFHF